MSVTMTTHTDDVNVDSGVGEPDPDTIKMFVGQIPRQWNEPECRQLFEKYGPVHSLNILRDKITQNSKGCCFVTYFHRKDAMAAQASLHNIEVVAGMHHPIQMKPADSENRNDRKLFIGQVSKKYSEEEVRQLFSRFGNIEECSVLRDVDGKSRGCAFVTFSTRVCAVNATREMHHSQTMEGCTAPLVVKFADTQRDKDSKSGVRANLGHAPMTSPLGMGGAAQQAALLQQLGGGGINLQTLTALAALLQGGGQQQNMLGLLGNASLYQQPQTHGMEAFAQLQQAQLAHQQQVQQQQQLLVLLSQQQQQQQQQAAMGATQDSAHTGSGLAGYGGANMVSVAASTAAANQYTSLQQPIYQTAAMVQHQQQSGVKTMSPVAGLQSPLAHLGQPTAAVVDPLQHAIQQYALSSLTPSAFTVSPGATSGVGIGDGKGPEGANLFIYHLPQDFGDSDLMNTFSPFGSVLSAKVFMDKVTHLSKCFGFVSFDNATSAQNAIAAMNGFQIGTKRLKVQLKNERSHPYTKVA